MPTIRIPQGDAGHQGQDRQAGGGACGPPSTDAECGMRHRPHLVRITPTSYYSSWKRAVCIILIGLQFGCDLWAVQLQHLAPSQTFTIPYHTLPCHTLPYLTTPYHAAMPCACFVVLGFTPILYIPHCTGVDWYGTSVVTL